MKHLIRFFSAFFFGPDVTDGRGLRIDYKAGGNRGVC